MATIYRWNGLPLRRAEFGNLLAIDERCCCPDVPGGCSGNCVCGDDDLIEGQCQPFTPVRVWFQFSAAVTCDAPCGTIIGTGAEPMKQVDAGTQNPCCDYQAEVPVQFSCCDCTTPIGSPGFAEFQFRCEDRGSGCVIIGTATICNQTYEVVDMDIGEGVNNTANRTSQDVPGECCIWPPTVTLFCTYDP